MDDDGKIERVLRGSPEGEHMKAAVRLREARRANGRISRGDLRNSAESFRLLEEVDKQEYKEDLDFLCANSSIGNERKYGLPDVENGKQFRERFSWIRRSRLKAEESGSSFFRDDDEKDCFEQWREYVWKHWRVKVGIWDLKRDMDGWKEFGLYNPDNGDGPWQWSSRLNKTEE